MRALCARRRCGRGCWAGLRVSPFSFGGAGFTAVVWHPGGRAAPTRAGRIPGRVGYGTARNRLMSD
jgi:hypothetical protein